MSDTDPTEEQIQEFKRVARKLRLARSAYMKRKLLYDVVKECISESALDPQVKTRIDNILRDSSCSQASTLDAGPGGTSLLGLQPGQDPLDPEQGQQVVKAVAAGLERKEDEVCRNFKRVTGAGTAEALVRQQGLAQDERSMPELMRQVAEQRRRFVENLQQEADLLDQMVKLRVDRLPEVCDEKVKECDLTTRVNALRAKIIREKTRVDVFTENGDSLAAYEALMKDIEEQQQECKGEIERLKKLKEKYNAVASKQFDQLLWSFVECKLALEKKRKMYDAMQGGA